MRKRTFKFLSYFEKLFLVLFYKKGWFEKSISNLYRKKDIIDYRRKNYPIIYSFHLNYNKVNYELNNLRLLIKQYKYYSNSKFYNKKLHKIFNFCFKNKDKLFIKYLLLQNLYIKNYYNLISYSYFIDKNNLNLIKFNRLFNIFLIRSSNKLITFNLDRWYDWYNYCFNKKVVKYLNNNIRLSKKELKNIRDFKMNKLIKWINLVYKYRKRVINFYMFSNEKFNGIIHFKLGLNNFFKIKINPKFNKLLKYYIIKFSESSVTKNINSSNFKMYSFQYLRKNRIFNKGRYSRNRQLYRTGVYWCLWLNIIMVYGLYFMFYRFTFNFGFFWWGILIVCYSTIFSRIIKYNFFNLNYLYKEFLKLISWYGFIVYNIYELFKLFFRNYFSNVYLYNHIAKYKNDTLSFFYDNYYFYLVKYINKFIKNKKKIKMTFIWQGMKEKDTSFLRYKTLIHFLKETYRLIITK